jgi:predicted RNA-binding protein with PUA-like domain
MDTKKISYWLMKTEPETFSFEQLVRDQKTFWNGVRNFQARNFLKQASVGDLVIIYHSGEERAAVGIAKVVREAYPDPDPEKPGDWVQIDVEAISQLPRPVTLSEIKEDPRFKDLLLIRQSRLSVMPVSQQHFELILDFAHAKSSI